MRRAAQGPEVGERMGGKGKGGKGRRREGRQGRGRRVLGRWRRHTGGDTLPKKFGGFCTYIPVWETQGAWSE